TYTIRGTYPRGWGLAVRGGHGHLILLQALHSPRGLPFRDQGVGPGHPFVRLFVERLATLSVFFLSQPDPLRRCEENSQLHSRSIQKTDRFLLLFRDQCKQALPQFRGGSNCW